MTSNNVPPRDEWPTPKNVKDWTPEEYLETLEEDQDERRREYSPDVIDDSTSNRDLAPDGQDSDD